MGLWSGDKQVSPETVIAQAKAIAHRQMIVENLYRDAQREEMARDPYDEPVDATIIGNETVPEPTDTVEIVDDINVVPNEVLPTAKVLGTTVAAKMSDDIDVPNHVAVGFYRAVNHTGQAKIIQVLPTSENENASSRDFYMHEVEGDRWYLIRLDVPTVATSQDSMFLQ